MLSSSRRSDLDSIAMQEQSLGHVIRARVDNDRNGRCASSCGGGGGSGGSGASGGGSGGGGGGGGSGGGDGECVPRLTLKRVA